MTYNPWLICLVVGIIAVVLIIWIWKRKANKKKAAAPQNVFEEVLKEKREFSQGILEASQTLNQAVELERQGIKTLKENVAEREKLEGKIQSLPKKKKGWLARNKYTVLLSILGLYFLVICIIAAYKN
jgi:hypothetical protein